jgi:hypothetical protein
VHATRLSGGGDDLQVAAGHCGFCSLVRGPRVNIPWMRFGSPNPMFEYPFTLAGEQRPTRKSAAIVLHKRRPRISCNRSARETPERRPNRYSWAVEKPRVKQGSRFLQRTVFMRRRGCDRRRKVFEIAVSHDPHNPEVSLPDPLVWGTQSGAPIRK